MNIVLGNDDLDPKIIDSGKFGPITENCSDFYKISYSKQIEHVN